MNKVCIKISGMNLNRLLNKLIANDVFIDNLKAKNKYIVFYINNCDLFKVEKVCKEERKKYYIISISKTRNMLANTKRFLGFFLASIIIFCYIFSFNNVLCLINIVGGDSENKSEVMQVLKNNSISVGFVKNKIDVKNIEKVILKNCKGLKGCSVQIIGGKLNIELFPEEKDVYINIQIKSKYDAKITKINIASGDCKLNIGDIVKKGDLLIDSDKGAIGEIFGQVCFVATEIYNEKQIFQHKTGNVIENKYFKIRNKNIYKTQNINSFSNYITEKCVFYPLSNYFLPIKCEVFKFYEIENIEKVIPFSSVENDIKNKLYLKVLNDIVDKNTITNVAYSVIEEGGIYKVDCFVECEIDITK